MLACEWWQDLLTRPTFGILVARKRHENAECSSVVGVAEQRNHA